MNKLCIDDYNDVPYKILASGSDYPEGFTLPLHKHERAQCLYAVTGVITVTSSQGSWVVPPRRASWIPAGVEHEFHTSGLASTRSIYIHSEHPIMHKLSKHCAVIEVSSLLHELLTAALNISTQYHRGSREDHLMELLVHEISNMKELPLNAPLPRDPSLSHLCLAFLQSPTMEVGIDYMAQKANMSRRNFTRLFRHQTGMSFNRWRQQACLLSALTQLSLGRSVTYTAMELGYSSTSAFTVAFSRILGAPPSQYLIR